MLSRPDAASGMEPTVLGRYAQVITAFLITLVSGSLEAVGRVVLLAFPYSWILASRTHPIWWYGWPALSVVLLFYFSALTFAGWWIP